MQIIWPDRTYTTISKPQLNKLHYIQQPVAKGSLAYVDSIASGTALFGPVQQHFDKHAEDDYIDFYYERNLPVMLSRQGPHVAKGDVDGDGLEDLYVGGAKGQMGQLYLQTKDGKFVKKEQDLFRQFRDFEDVAVHFFDADKDGDLDLFLGAGGNNVHPGSREIQHRLYKNDGKGAFTLDAASFPPNNTNISVAVSHDYDGDGDEDLFVGSRSVPYNYGQTPQSYLFQNDGQGHFKMSLRPLLPTRAC
jgi:hypothetical protein